MSIVDRDCEFYAAEVERHRDALRRCAPDEEARNNYLLAAARRASDAVEAYRKALEVGA
ncbi:hypothetical protein KQX64_17670 [Rhodopseudomonas palustris]|nr:hypothetical protein KQX64_17670 [Rhodopseudomonas palustris]